MGYCQNMTAVGSAIHNQGPKWAGRLIVSVLRQFLTLASVFSKRGLRVTTTEFTYEIGYRSHLEMPPDAHCGFFNYSMKIEPQQLCAPPYTPTQGLVNVVERAQQPSRGAAQGRHREEKSALSKINSHVTNDPGDRWSAIF